MTVTGKPIDITHSETFTVQLKPPPCTCCWCTGEVPWSDNFMAVCVLEFVEGEEGVESTFFLPCHARGWLVRFKPPYAYMRPVLEEKA